MPRYSSTKVIMTPELKKALEGFTPEEIKTGRLKSSRPSSGIPLDPSTLRQTLQTAMAEAKVGQVLEQARKARGQTLAEVGKKLGLSRARISQREKADSLAIGDVVAQAGALGYDVRIVLEPRQGGEPIAAQLSTKL